MTAPFATPTRATHYVNKHGRPVPVIIVDAHATLGGRPAIQVEAVSGAPFPVWTHGGWAAQNRASYPPALVHELPDSMEPMLQETEVDAEFRFGFAILEDAPAPEFNAAMTAWRVAAGYEEAGVER